MYLRQPGEELLMASAHNLAPAHPRWGARLDDEGLQVLEHGRDVNIYFSSVRHWLYSTEKTW